MIVQFPGFTRLRRLHWSTWTPTEVTAVSISCLVLTSACRHLDDQVNQHSFQQEAWIAWVSWAILFASGHSAEPTEDAVTSPSSRLSFWTSRPAWWLASAAVVASQLLLNQLNLTWALPLTTVAVTLQNQYVTRGTARSDVDTEEEIALTPSKPALVSKDGPNIVEQVRLPWLLVCNIGSFVLLLGFEKAAADRMTWVTGISFVLTQTLAVASLSRIASWNQSDSASHGSGIPDTRHYLSQLSVPALLWLTLIVLLKRPEFDMTTVAVVLHALLQSIWWAAAITLIRQQLVNTVTNMDTVALGVQLALNSTTIILIISAMTAVLLSTTQSMLALRPGTNTRRFIFAVVGILGVVVWVREDSRIVDRLTRTFPASQISGGHPIETLIAEKRVYFSRLVERQSKTLDQAVTEYKRRYRRDPPLGFDQWFDLAQQHGYVFVDEFDTFMQSIEPFYGVHPAILQDRIEAVKRTGGLFGKVAVIEYSNRNVTIHKQFDDVWDNLLEPSWTEIVPYEATIMINVFDHAEVLESWDEVGKAVRDAHDPTSGRYAHDAEENYPPLHYELKGYDGWAMSRQGCPIGSPARQDVCPKTTYESPITFISNASYSLDVCEHCEFRYQHAYLVRPGNIWLAHELTPIWTNSKPSHYNDLLNPSHYYNAVRKKYDVKLDKPWAEKDNKFYWVGRSTGGESKGDEWKMFHRHRFVTKTSRSNDEPVQMLEEKVPGSNHWTPRYSTMSEVHDLFEVRMAEILQCTEAACAAQREYFNMTVKRPLDPPEAAYSHKFVVDLDGNAFSGRYYRLLRSKSVVIKSTMLKEWHDDFLIPWVHYVPLSVGYHELPELARFLATTERGLELSERIARESTEWHDKVLRDVDLRLAFLRMVLEFGRLLQPDLI